MAKVNYKDLFTLTIDEIEKRVKYNNTSTYDSQLSRTNVSPVSFGTGNSSVETSDLINSIMDLLEEAIPQQIIEGLEVTATDPISTDVLVTLGKGSVGGRLYELEANVTLTIPFDNTNKMFYVVLYNGGIMIEKSVLSTQLAVAKIIVPKPGTTQYVQDTKDSSWNAYIVNFKEYKLYGYQDRFEEDTIDLLRNNIGPILADNLIGNIRLSENLKITNTQGTLQLDSNQLLLKDFNQNTLSKFNQNGIYFYDVRGVELAKFSNSGARIGNIVIGTNSLYSGNFVAGVSGFEIRDDGDVEINNLEVRGIIHATGGDIGGWTIASDSIYATTTGTIKTSATVGAGSNGVILDKDGLRVYDNILGEVVNLPSNGSAPTFSSGIINSTIFNVNTNAVIRTSETVGSGDSDSFGVLINNTGFYACGMGQLLNEANIKILSTGDAYFKGEINASSGIIGNVTIQNDMLSGGTITGSTIVSPIIETSLDIPKIRIDDKGIYYQVAGNVGKYAEFKYADGTVYGTGVSAFLFNVDYPVLSIMAEGNLADIRLYNRDADPGSGTGPHEIGDLICVDGDLKICTSAGQPGTFSNVDGFSATTTLDNLSSVAINTSLISDTDNTDDLGSPTKEWKDLYIDGTAYIDAIDLNGTSLTTILDSKLDTILTADPGEHSVSGIKITLTAHENITFGDVCYINASGEAQIIDADAIATMSGICMATATINADTSGIFLLQGIARDDTWNWTVGGLIYGTVTGTSGNTLSQTTPTGTDDVIQILGVATHADRMYFNPQLSQVEHV